MTIFFDADAFIAINNTVDTLHEKATQLLSHLDEEFPNYDAYTSWEVVTETTTKLSYYVSKQHAISFLNNIDEYDFKVIYPDKKQHLKVAHLFSSIKTKKVSLTDCANMIIVKDLKIDWIFSFDKIYQKQGFPVLTSLFSD